MADKIGVLGEATVATAATTTVYTCPAAKAAGSRSCGVDYLMHQQAQAT